MPNQAPVTNITDPRWLRAISHPIRIRLLSMLDEEPASPVILAAKLDQPLGTVAYHVRTLYDLGLLKLVKTRQRRGATEHYYQTAAHPRSTEQAWDELDGVSKQRLLTALLDRAHELATRSAAAGGFDGRDSHLTSRSVKLDAQGLQEVVAEAEKMLVKIEAIEAESALRIEANPETKVNAGVTMMVFEALPFSSELQKDAATAAPEQAPAKSGKNAKGAKRPTAETAGVVDTDLDADPQYA